MVNETFKEQFHREIVMLELFVRSLSQNDKLVFDALAYNLFLDTLCSDCDTPEEAITKLQLFVEDIKHDFEHEVEDLPF